ncbi:hypothetical protein [Spirosoma gilvum]
MTYSTHLLPGYSSWFEFYADVKALLDESDLFCYEDHKLRLFDPHRPTHQVACHRFSVRYIEQQTLAELYELRAIQTFSRDELRHLHYALELVMKSEVGHDPMMKALYQKVHELFDRELTKLWTLYESDPLVHKQP